MDEDPFLLCLGRISLFLVLSVLVVLVLVSALDEDAVTMLFLVMVILHAADEASELALVLTSALSGMARRLKRTAVDSIPCSIRQTRTAERRERFLLFARVGIPPVASNWNRVFRLVAERD